MAIMIPFFQQVTGINVISFYAPILFRTIGFRESASLLSGVINGVVGMISTFISMLVVDKFGRRSLLIFGGVQMLVCQVAIGIIMALELGDQGEVRKGYACPYPNPYSIEKMILTTERAACGREYKVRDVSRADFGRLQIQLAESERPGLMACRAEFGPSQPLRGTRITGCLHMTAPTAVLVETLTALGATVRWCSSDAYSTEDHIAAAVARDSASLFAWRGQSPHVSIPGLPACLSFIYALMFFFLFLFTE